MVWDAVEGINTKGTYPIISGRINDIAWDGDSQRIIAVGDGREMVSWNFSRIEKTKTNTHAAQAQGDCVPNTSRLVIPSKQCF